MTAKSSDLSRGDASTPLSGLRIVSMAEQYPGPFCTMILSDMGADVIQVERPGIGDPSRFLKSFYESLNRGKRSVALDIRRTDDKAKLLELLASADIFLEGFRPGKLAKQGLGYEDIAKINPRMIYCSISGYGQTGPYRNRPGHDITFQGIGGALNERITGDVVGMPPATLMGDVTSSLYATIGVLAALVARQRTGHGTYIDVAMADAVLATQTPFVASADEVGTAPPQGEPGYDLYRCADGKYLTLSIAHEDEYWRRLCRDLGLSEFEALSRADRVSRRQVLKEKIAAAIGGAPLAHWAAVFGASDQMWGPAYTLGEVTDDPQFVARGILERLVRADGVSQTVVRQPIGFSSYRNAPLRRAPRLNENEDAKFE